MIENMRYVRVRRLGRVNDTDFRGNGITGT